MFPPGRARLATNPRPTGSPTVVVTIGIVPMACLAARVGFPRGNDAVDLETNQLRREIRKSIYLPFCRPVLDSDVFLFHVTKLPQSLAKGVEPG